MTTLRTEFTYDVQYCLAPDGKTTRSRRITVVDPDPQPGCGPAIAYIHRALRNSSPEEFGHMQHPEELVIISVRAPADEAGA